MVGDQRGDVHVAVREVLVGHPVQHRGALSEHEHPVVGTYRQIGPPARFDRTPASIRRHAPLLGQDTVGVLADIGLTPQEIEDLLATGAATGR